MSNRIVPIAAAISVAAALSPAKAADPFSAPDERPISISGEVQSASRDSFIFDYGDGFVTVHMDDDDLAGETGTLAKGERVTVYGEVDDEPMEAMTILAGSVYSHDRNAWYVADTPELTRGDRAQAAPPLPEAADKGARVRVSGTVSTVDGRRLTLSTGAGEIAVDTAGMDRDPTDKSGRLRLRKGATVEVTGALDRGFLDRREIAAERIVRIADEPAGAT